MNRLCDLFLIYICYGLRLPISLSIHLLKPYLCCHRDKKLSVQSRIPWIDESHPEIYNKFYFFILHPMFQTHHTDSLIHYYNLTGLEWNHPIAGESHKFSFIVDDTLIPPLPKLSRGTISFLLLLCPLNLFFVIIVCIVAFNITRFQTRNFIQVFYLCMSLLNSSHTALVSRLNNSQSLQYWVLSIRVPPRIFDPVALEQQVKNWTVFPWFKMDGNL